ncbi:uncharacterized protein FPRO_10396 [Fusarium proliferatum ET1]|uniref:Uncharacterized protein n=1 Tax=Fusarium proliferatum (strain ET1) TaxID=1227346 RepID=A0A1L7VJR7_FUSPR|nr:uncharacterized protein FPRO_10396 [Fusarium proliferatum ET1]CZR40808.1 uncharacterized protein FPRO_10396 [Fusarium proliferatum ET1]
MAGLRRSKRLESGNQPDQDKVIKIARVSKDQENAVTGKRRRLGRAPWKDLRAQGSTQRVATLQPTIFISELTSLKASLENAPPKDVSPKDTSPNRASEQQPDEEFLPANPFKDKEEGFADFRRAIQTSIGLDDQQVYLYRKWKELGNQIQAVSGAAGFSDRSWDSLDEPAQQRFIGYSPHAQQLFEDAFSREHISSCWIWEVVDENFFAGKSQDIEPGFKYPNWRYTTIDLYYSLKGVRSSDLRIEPGCVVKILKKALDQYLPDNPGPWLKQMLSQLAETVVKFELWFDCGCETLRLVFDHPENKEPSGFPFSPRAKGSNARKVMERVDGFDAMYEGQLVNLVVSPILMVYGTPDGYDYEDEVVKTEENGEGDGEEEAKIIKDKEGGTKYEDEKKNEGED